MKYADNKKAVHGCLCPVNDFYSLYFLLLFCIFQILSDILKLNTLLEMRIGLQGKFMIKKKVSII